MLGPIASDGIHMLLAAGVPRTPFRDLPVEEGLLPAPRVEAFDQGVPQP